MPWNYLRTDRGAVIKFAQINKNGDVEIEEIKKLITNKTKPIPIQTASYCILKAQVKTTFFF